MYAQDLELVTVTESSFVLTWYTASSAAPARCPPAAQPGPVPTDGVVRYGTDPARLEHVAVETGPDTAYHYVEVTGLEPGTTYYYQALSDGRRASPRPMPRLSFRPDGVVRPEHPVPGDLDAIARGLISSDVAGSASPGTVTTLVPPPGDLLFTIALSNDLHTGEEPRPAAGTYLAAAREPSGLPPYPVTMAQAMARDAAARGADVLLVAGDLTAAARPAELAQARALLDRFGTLTLAGPLSAGDYVVARGNHDVTGTAWAGAVAARADRHDLASLDGLATGTLSTTEAGGLRIIGLDTTTLDLPAAGPESQFAALRTILAEAPDQPTLVFGHHPVTDESARTALNGPSACLRRVCGARLEALYAAAPGVFLHHSGHTHRNLRTSSAAAPGVEFLEVAATKEYPGGFALLRVYQGGYMVNFYKSSSDLARQWSQISSAECPGLHPAYALGRLADRNHVVSRDFAALSAMRHRPWWGQRPRSLRSTAATA